LKIWLASETSQVEDVVKGLLKSGSKSYDAVKEFEMLGNMASSTGVSITELGNTYIDAKKGGKDLANDLYDLSTNGIPIIEALATQTKHAKEEILGLAEAGQIGFPQFKQALETMNQPKGEYYQAAYENGHDLSSESSKFNKNLDGYAATLGKSQSGLFHTIVSGANQALDYMTKNVENKNRVNTANEKYGISPTGFGKITSFFTSTGTWGGLAQDLGIINVNGGEYAGEVRNKYGATSKDDKNSLSEKVKKINSEIGKVNKLPAGKDFMTSQILGLSQEEKSNKLSILLNERDELMKLLTATNAEDHRKPNYVPQRPKNHGGAGSSDTVSKPIVLNSLVNTIIIQSVDGSIPTKDLKDKVGKAFLELISDVNQRTK
jgi:hypothetical protein